MVTFTAYITYPVIFTVYLYSNIPITMFIVCTTAQLPVHFPCTYCMLFTHLN